jgi:hypothetical protein
MLEHMTDMRNAYRILAAKTTRDKNEDKWIHLKCISEE